MMRSLQHRFVELLPETLEPGVIYISLEYVTASHLCCCGCGAEVVTPISPVAWRITFDGESISLWPSVGSWNLRCRSHYFIDRGRVRLAGPWTDEQVAAERRRDKEAKADYFGVPSVTLPVSQPPEVEAPLPQQGSWWGRMRRRWFGGS